MNKTNKMIIIEKFAGRKSWTLNIANIANILNHIAYSCIDV